jgi:hypothetical protein
MRLPGKSDHRRQAEAVHRWARERGMTKPRAWIMACFAAYGRKCFTWQKTIAEFTGFCIRTVQRAARQAKDLGLLTATRFKRGATPEGASGPLTCGGTERVIVGWGLSDSSANVLRLKQAIREGYAEQVRAARRTAEANEARAAVAEFLTLPPLSPSS